MSKTGKECWDKLQVMQAGAIAEGKELRDKPRLC